MSGKSGGMPELVPVLDRHRFDEAALARHLRDRLPGFDGPVEVRQFLGGQSNPTFHIATRAGDYVLRKKPPGKLLPRAHEVEREYRIIRALEGSEVPVPRARLLEEDASVIGTAFFVMDNVPGRVFFDRVPLAAPPADRAAIYEDMARVLAALHKVDWRAAGLEGFGKPAGYMARQIALWTRQWEAAKVEEMPEMDRLAAWLPEHLPQEEEATIAHGDYRLGNLIIHPEQPRIVAVLDWELATIGHPLADLGYCCLTYHFDPGPEGIAGVAGLDLAGTGIPDEAAFVARYCALAGRPVPPSISVFVVFSMFRLASIVAGVWRRALDGNASDPRAIGYRDRYRAMAERAWALAQRIDAGA
ncbi:phosphotransferase family protein [Roseicella aerolata]|uniref:Phosphotransferase family protein n=1 Tax=Roseicella aerolata TaxID=2883479 RepID=A0A9X1L8T8_9PROT|nr:phosphotransferase family protein [Roseicella aerolata]MCB4820268.1 phosphotransferase family protein [Roseicella aerolata]